MIKTIQIIIVAISTLVIIFSLNSGMALEPATNSSAIQPILLQTATVPCKDTENYGSGPNRDRICAHGTVAFCDWEDYEAPANNGTCTLSSDPEEN